MSVEVFGRRPGPGHVPGGHQPAEDGSAEAGVLQLGEGARDARDQPAWAQAQLAAFGDDVKVPLYIQSGIHGNEYEGVDAKMRIIEKLATTPYGADPEVDGSSTTPSSSST